MRERRGARRLAPILEGEGRGARFTQFRTEPMLLLWLCAFAPAFQVVEYQDRAAWLADVGGAGTADFSGYPENTPITDQYLALGMRFTQGNEKILTSAAFVMDTKGVDCSGGAEISFISPVTALGVDFPGALQIDLYDGGALIWSSSRFAGSGTGFFAGVISTAPFTRAVLDDWTDHRAYLDAVSVAVSGLRLEFQGGCPGSGSVEILEATPRATGVLAMAPAPGSLAIPPGRQCEGTILGLGTGARVVAVLLTDDAGSATLNGAIPAQFCGFRLQFVDLVSCSTSNVATIP
jgi:hypothetical protein